MKEERVMLWVVGAMVGMGVAFLLGARSGKGLAAGAAAGRIVAGGLRIFMHGSAEEAQVDPADDTPTALNLKDY
jgi:hypothetical protein